MGFFDRFRKKPPASPDASTTTNTTDTSSLTDDELREHLFAATGATLVTMCQQHRDRIVKLFPSWTKVPVALRNDPAALKRYGDGIIGVARCFVEVLGDDRLLERLKGAAGDNPLVEWQKLLQQTRRVIEQGEFLHAIPPLESMLSIAGKLRGTGVEQLLPITLEYLAEARFHSGDPDGAVEPLERALAIVQDDEGKRACARNLYEVYRYRGDFEKAAKVPHLAPELAARVAAGEPLVRVVVAFGKDQHEIDDAPITKDGKVEFAFVRNRIGLRGAELRTDEGQGLAVEERFAEALRCFEAAAQIDPYDPHCRYLAGLTLVHLERYADACARYAEVEKLAPGWFNSRFDGWMAEQLRDGKLPHAAFSILIELEDRRLRADDKRALAEQCIARWTLGAAELHRGRALVELGRHTEAVEAFRRGIVTSVEPDVRSRLALELAMLTGDEATFKRAQDPRGNLLASAQARYVMRVRAAQPQN